MKKVLLGLALAAGLAGCGDGVGSSDPKLQEALAAPLVQKILNLCGGDVPDMIVPLATRNSNSNTTDQLLVVCPSSPKKLLQIKVG